jgi:glycosyltransferase involved in cell wall biosynthesis
MRSPARITVITSGHLATCPRMLKAADALSADGHRVRVVATRHEPWATEADADVRARRTFPVTTIDYARGSSGLTYWRTGVRYRAARAAADAVGAARTPFPIVARAFGRVHSELVAAAISEPADLFYGGTTGALAAVAEAARRRGVRYGVDLEDLHSGETSGDRAGVVDRLAARVEASTIAEAAFVTTSSEAIADVYRDERAAAPVVIHNTFALPSTPPDFSRADPSVLRVYWFSQTIGPGRGLEDAVVALGRAARTTKVRAELALRGRPQPGYLESLRQLAAEDSPLLQIVHQAPAPPDAMIDLARGSDVGLALEQMTPRNRQLCVTNKAFTYIMAGVAVAISDTPGQHALGVDLREGAALVPPGDADALAEVFARWMREPARLDCAKRAAWQAAVRRWRWDHELERGRLCAIVREALS